MCFKILAKNNKSDQKSFDTQSLHHAYETGRERQEYFCCSLMVLVGVWEYQGFQSFGGFSKEFKQRLVDCNTQN